jgi:hypothetical protein
MMITCLLLIATGYCGFRFFGAWFELAVFNADEKRKVQKRAQQTPFPAYDVFSGFDPSGRALTPEREE